MEVFGGSKNITSSFQGEHCKILFSCLPHNTISSNSLHDPARGVTTFAHVRLIMYGAERCSTERCCACSNARVALQGSKIRTRLSVLGTVVQRWKSLEYHSNIFKFLYYAPKQNQLKIVEGLPETQRRNIARLWSWLYEPLRYTQST